MDISICEDEDEDHKIMSCFLAPVPVVWTMFTFFYALTGFRALVGFMIASSQFSLDKEMWGLWMALGSLALGLALFLVAQRGQKLSKDEMLRLRHFIVDLKFPPIEEAEVTQKVQI
jgi:hypothetical protein